MTRLRELLTRAWWTFRPGRRDADLEQELRLHAELAGDAGAGSGRFVHAMDALRDQRGVPWLDDLMRDLRYGMRVLNRQRMFAAVAVLTLAIGIGATTAVFSVVNGVLLRPLPSPEPERLVALRLLAPGAPGISVPDRLVADPERVARLQNEVVARLSALPGVTAVGFASVMYMEGLGTPWDAIRPEGATLSDAEVPPMRVFKFVSPAFFKTTGTRLIAGRDYDWADLYGRRSYVVVSENLARELWRTPQAAIGKRVTTALPGVIAYTVSQRTREIGIRLALGAQQGDVKRMFVRAGLALVAAGIAVGLAAAATLTQVMASVLFGVSPLDPVTFAAVPLVLLTAALVASYLPARRVAGISPVEALKSE